jgi:predicted nucleic acid-binding protein
MATSETKIIIADTSGLVSLFHPLDSNHYAAVDEAQRLRANRSEVVVPIAVYIEFLNILGRMLGHKAAVEAGAELSDHFVIFNNLSSSLLHAAMQIFEKTPESVSHTDCMVVASCDEYATREIFGFDRDFVRLGCRIIDSDRTRAAA